MNMVIQSFDNLHDNRVLRYCADFEAHSLHMDTQAGAGEKVSLHFTGLLGGTISYGFSACCSIEELRERMDREHIRVFVIDSSLGLCGFVLAQEVELQCRSLLIK